MKKQVPIALVALAVVAGVLALPSHAAKPKRLDISPPPNANERPNIVLIVSDDQTNWEMRWMPRTRRLLGAHGVRFTKAINPHPLCCPARAEILSGEFAQNNGVRHNTGPYGGYQRFATYEDGRNLRDNLAAWLQRSGYKTGFIGKMLNGYHPDTQPRMDGWDYWSPLVQGVYDYYNFTLWDNGNPRHYRDRYVTYSIRNQARRQIATWSKGDKPFFLWVSQVAPHRSAGRFVKKYYKDGVAWEPPIPAVRDRSKFNDVALPTENKPSFNEDDISDKPSTMQVDKLDPASQTYLFRQRIRSLRALDRANAAIIRSLAKHGVLDNTVIVYISDNGFMLGEHRISTKNYPYDDDLRIPMYWRGPGIPEGVRSDALATTVDIAPTVLSFAKVLDQVRQGGRTDGDALESVLSGSGSLNTTSLIQGGTADPAALDAFGWEWRGVHTARYSFVHWWTGEEELYDLERDPFQLDNLIDDGTGLLKNPDYAPVLTEMRRRYAALVNCKGAAECTQQDFGPEPQPAPAG